MINRKNIVVTYILSLIVLEFAAKYIVLGILWLFRFFGMPWLWNWYCTLNHPGHIRFMIVLFICTAGTIYVILKKRRR